MRATTAFDINTIERNRHGVRCDHRALLRGASSSGHEDIQASAEHPCPITQVDHLDKVSVVSWRIEPPRELPRKLRLEIIGDSLTGGYFKLCEEPDHACRATWHQRLTARRPLSSRRTRISSTTAGASTSSWRVGQCQRSSAPSAMPPRTKIRVHFLGRRNFLNGTFRTTFAATLLWRLVWHWLQQERSSSATLMVPTGRCPSWCEVWRLVSISWWRDPCWMSRSQHTKTPTIAHYRGSR